MNSPELMACLAESRVCRAWLSTLFMLGFACSGAPDSSDEVAHDPALSADEVELSDDLPVLSVEDREAEFQRRIAASLEPDEVAILENVLVERGIGTANVKFVGRMLMWGDTYFDADEVLATIEPVDKQRGYLFGTVVTSPDGPGPTPLMPLAPVEFARLFGGAVQFFRPFVAQTNMYVVPNSPTYLLTAFRKATTRIANAADDCLNTNNFSTINRTSYDQLGVGQAFMGFSFVIHGPRATSCPSGEGRGCALFPSMRGIRLTGGATVTRLLIGARVGLVSDFVTGDNGPSRGTMMHEVLHTMGVAHPFFEEGYLKLEIPATEHAGEGSLMEGGGQEDITSVDVDIIDTLYSPRSDTGCDYVSGFRTVTAN